MMTYMGMGRNGSYPLNGIVNTRILNLDPYPDGSELGMIQIPKLDGWYGFIHIHTKNRPKPTVIFLQVLDIDPHHCLNSHDPIHSE